MTDKPTPKEIDDLVYELRQAGKDDTYSLARAVLAKWGAPAQAAEPVAWLDPWTGTKVTTDYDAYGKHGIPLYTAPQDEEREPLPSVEIMRIVMGVEQQHNFLRGTTNWATAVGRAVERAHGIGGQHGTE